MVAGETQTDNFSIKRTGAVADDTAASHFCIATLYDSADLQRDQLTVTFDTTPVVVNDGPTTTPFVFVNPYDPNDICTCTFLDVVCYMTSTLPVPCRVVPSWTNHPRRERIVRAALGLVVLESVDHRATGFTRLALSHLLRPRLCVCCRHGRLHHDRNRLGVGAGRGRDPLFLPDVLPMRLLLRQGGQKGLLHRPGMGALLPVHVPLPRYTQNVQGLHAP